MDREFQHNAQSSNKQATIHLSATGREHGPIVEPAVKGLTQKSLTYLFLLRDCAKSSAVAAWDIAVHWDVETQFYIPVWVI